MKMMVIFLAIIFIEIIIIGGYSMFNKSIIVILILFFVGDISAQRRSSKKDESKQSTSASQAEDLVNQYGFSSKQELGEHLLRQGLTKTAEKTVKNYMNGESVSGRVSDCQELGVDTLFRGRFRPM